MTDQNGYAACVADNLVTEVIVIPPMEQDDDVITEYCNTIGIPGRWLYTSLTGEVRGKYAGIGDIYDPITDEFISTQPKESEES
jgi:hypothetical protein